MDMTATIDTHYRYCPQRRGASDRSALPTLGTAHSGIEVRFDPWFGGRWHDGGVEDETAHGEDGGRRRLRRRRRSVGSPADMPDHPPTTEREFVEPPTERKRPTEMDKAERGLRGLVGAGPSQLPITAAMRARDASRPSAEELAAADELPLVRRNYIPPDEPKTSK